MKPENPYPICDDQFDNESVSKTTLLRDTWQEGFDAAITWLKEPCTEHPDCGQHTNKVLIHTVTCYPPHRYLCPQCREKVGL